MIILLHGPDSYRREARKRELAAKFRGKHPLAPVSRIDAEAKEDLSRLAEVAGTPSLFDASGLVLLDSAYALEKKDVASLILPHRDSAAFVIIVSENDAPPKHFSPLSKDAPKGKYIEEEFAPLEGAAWKKFANSIAGEEGVAFTDAALAFLLDTYAGDAWGLVTEMKKLAFLGKKTIDLADIEGAGAPELPAFFAMLGSLKSPRAADRLSMLERAFAAGEPAAKLFHILAYQGASAMKFARYDYAVKSGKLEYEEALLDALLFQ